MVGLGPGNIVLDADPAPPPRGTASLPKFRPMSVVAKRLCTWINMPLGTKIGLGPGHIVLLLEAAHPPKGVTAPLFSTYVYCGQNVSFCWVLVYFTHVSCTSRLVAHSSNVLPVSIVKFTVMSVITQISTSVLRTTEVVALKPTAATLKEASRVPVSHHTPGMDSPVQVCK